MIRSALLALALCAALASDAAADDHPSFDAPHMWTDTAAADDARSRSLHAAAFQYWQRILPERVAAECPAGVYGFFADIADGETWGYGGGCWAMLDRAKVLLDDRAPRAEYVRGGRAYSALDECARWTHEFGHAVGLAHPDDDSRFPVLSYTEAGTAPRECRRAVRLMYPRDMPAALRLIRSTM